MSPSVLAFHQRAATLLAADERPPLGTLDALITDGCAEALTVETEIRRVRRAREESMRELERPEHARAVLALGDELAALEDRLETTREAVSSLMRQRSRQRLREFVAGR